ncbi:MAG: cation transporter [bacterium]|nr:cation transporter [bacterium]
MKDEKLGNHDHGHDHGHGHSHDHAITNKKKLVVVIFFNMVITISEYIGGILSGSLALVSDAGHNLSDVLSLMLGYAGEKVSGADPSKKYTFGMKRFEVLIALINALTLVFIGIFIVYESVERFRNPVAVDISIMLPVAVIGLLGNVFSILVLARNKESNLNMKAAFLHLLYDAISSVAVIIGGIVIYITNIYWIDLIISLGIVLMIAWSSMSIVKESLRIFLQGSPDHIDSDEVYRSLLEIDSVGSVHGLHIWSISSTEIFLSCHICVDKDSVNADTDGIIRNVNSILEEKFEIKHTTIQVENKAICGTEPGSCCR